MYQIASAESLKAALKRAHVYAHLLLELGLIPTKVLPQFPPFLVFLQMEKLSLVLLFSQDG